MGERHQDMAFGDKNNMYDRVTRRPLFPGHVLFSRPKKCVRQGFQKRPGFCFVGYLCLSGSFTNYCLRPYKFWKGYLSYVPPSCASSDCRENCHWTTDLSVARCTIIILQIRPF